MGTRLWETVEIALGAESSSLQVEALLSVELAKCVRMSQVKLVLDQLEAAKRNVAQDKASRLLDRVFDHLSQHPLETRRQQGRSISAWRVMLDNAIALTRRIANHDVAIPIRYWKILLFNLGRSGRLEELEQLCLELVSKYLPASSALVPVHRDDWPQPAANQKMAPETNRCTQTSTERHKAEPGREQADMGWKHPADEVGGHQDGFEKDGPGSRLFLARLIGQRWTSSGFIVPGRRTSRSQAEEKRYIPTDYPFTRRSHPLQKLFDPHFRRSVIRWGFDQTLATRPKPSSLLGMSSAGMRKFDVACGVRLLAQLRDKGVLIETEMMRATVMTRIAVGQVPGRRRHRSRDDNEFDLSLIKNLVDKAWGSELLPSLMQMRNDIDRMKPQVQRRYSELFVTSVADGWTLSAQCKPPGDPCGRLSLKRKRRRWQRQ
ncbi:pentatricopeptide repeat domain-containing protein [Ophiocordyceps camponoti-floridani]|uniref:Pentatricopeptide repeat domain-containing protein n=1 Tax=Ophiocordyceps camponoti-floridani TaxID=2030778 RepID=A0A8H4Q2K6_9HYPO|nr:pentatricopeptide repeat domain-containing protein [Ophiocordyceps camponoti-floridani]